MSRPNKHWQQFYTVFGLFIIFNFAIIQTIFHWSDIDNNLSLVSTNSDIDSTHEYDMSQHTLFSNTMHEHNDTINSLTFNHECWDYIYTDFYDTDSYKSIPDQCIIQYNSSYSIRFRIIETLLNFLHLVESLNDWDKGSIYAIKTYPFYKQSHYQEYLIMISLTQFCNEHMECHTNKVYNTHYPFIRYRNENDKSYVILFMEYLENTVKYLAFQKQLWRNTSLEFTLKFIDNCFNNVSIVLDQLWKIGLLHNDLHKENILVSNDNINKCYLIDFNQMYKFGTSLKQSDKKEYRGVVSIASPMHWHYLATDNDRHKFIDKYGDNSFDKLKQFGSQSQKYKINIFILEALLKSKSIHELDVNNDKQSRQYFTKYVLNTIIFVDDRRYHINSSDVEMYGKIKNIWCCRIEQIIYIIQLLKEYNSEYPNVNTLNILQNMFDLYYQLKNELHYFDIICNQCVLNEKYQDMDVRPKHIKYTL